MGQAQGRLLGKPLKWLYGRLAQLGERLPYKQEVGGSIPSPPIEAQSGSSLGFHEGGLGNLVTG